MGARKLGDLLPALEHKWLEPDLSFTSWLLGYTHAVERSCRGRLSGHPAGCNLVLKIQYFTQTKISCDLLCRLQIWGLSILPLRKFRGVEYTPQFQVCSWTNELF